MAQKHSEGERSDSTELYPLNEVVNLQSINDLEYLSWVLMEALRIQSPFDSIIPLHLTQDAKIGGIEMRKGDEFRIDIHSIHHDPSQWQKPLEFIPERFDQSNPISLTPNGKKRNHSSWIPFLGGKRACFGKTFAESTLKIAGTYLCQAFNFKFVNKKFEAEFPIAHFGMHGRDKIEIILTKASEIVTETA